MCSKPCTVALWHNVDETRRPSRAAWLAQCGKEKLTYYLQHALRSGMAKAVFMSSKPSSMLHSCTLQCGIAKAAFHVQHACLVAAASDGLAT